MRRTKGFTLVELLVVIGIIALLVSILMPALGRARELAKRIQCASQLSGIGKAVAMYQNEYRDSNPRAWKTSNDAWGFGGTGGGTDYNAPDLETCVVTGWCDKDANYSNRNRQTAGSCLYLLVKHEDVDTKMFVCPSAPDDRIMGLDEAIAHADIAGLTPIELWEDLNDFGFSNHLSYSYNDPWNRLLDSSASASLVLAADKSPAFDFAEGDFGFMKNPACGGKPATGDDGNLGDPDLFSGTWDDTSVTVDVTTNPQQGNSRNHQNEMQNVLFADTHVKRYGHPCVGTGEDNIFTFHFLRPQNPPYTNYMLGAWGSGGSGDGDMYTSADPIFGPTDRDSYLGN